MPPKNKSRLVTFRVSNEEYDYINQSYSASGARSISEFARGALLDRAENLRPRSAMASAPNLASLGRELSELDANLRSLSNRIRVVLGVESTKRHAAVESSAGRPRLAPEAKSAESGDPPGEPCRPALHGRD